MNLFQKSLVLGGSVLLFAGSALAATNCATPVATCNASFSLTVQIDPLVRVTGFSDFNFGGAWDGTSAMDQNANLVVNTNSANSRNVSITFTGDGGTGNNEFKVEDGALSIPYHLFFNFTTGAATTERFSTTAFSGAVSNTTLSSNTADANVRVVLNATDLTGALDGTYLGTVTAVIAPV